MLTGLSFALSTFSERRSFGIKAQSRERWSDDMRTIIPLQRFRLLSGGIAKSAYFAFINCDVL
jgi:hypothetical protein